MTESPGARHPTIYDVAQAAGVSKSLVSLVLQGSPRVSPARRAAVQEAIDRLHYRPSSAAASLAGSRTRTIGVLLDDYRNLWFVELLAGIQHELAPLGFRVAVEDFTTDPQAAARPLDSFVALRVDGIVIATEPTPEMVGTSGIPVVVAGTRELSIPGADVVANDDRLGGQVATEHLLGLGHREIGHVTGRGGAGRVRASAYVDTIRAAGLAPRVERGTEGGTMEADGYQAASKILDDHPATTGIFAANDLMALGVLAAAREHGRRVPEDLSLVGYDNSPLASAHLLQLTTVDDMSTQVGAAAARSVLSRIDDATSASGGALPTRTTLVTPKLVRRSTTAAAPTR